MQTQQAAAKVAVKQALTFHTKADRDNFVRFIGGQAIAAREYNKLQFADLRRAHRSEEARCVFFVQRYV